MRFREQIVRLWVTGDKAGKGGKKQHAARIMVPADKNVIQITSLWLDSFELGKLSTSVKACTLVAAFDNRFQGCLTAGRFSRSQRRLRLYHGVVCQTMGRLAR
jgi:hypothetical protein